MKNFPIIYSETEPNKECLWLHNGTLKYFGPNGWQEINCNSTCCTSTTSTTTTTSTDYPFITFTNNFEVPIKILNLCTSKTCSSTGYETIPSKGTIISYGFFEDGDIAINVDSDLILFNNGAFDADTKEPIPFFNRSDHSYTISTSYIISNNITSVTLYGEVENKDNITTTTVPPTTPKPVSPTN